MEGDAPPSAPPDPAVSAERGVRYRGASMDIGHQTWLEMSPQEKRDFYAQPHAPPGPPPSSRAQEN